MEYFITNFMLMLSDCFRDWSNWSESTLFCMCKNVFYFDGNQSGANFAMLLSNKKHDILFLIANTKSVS